MKNNISNKDLASELIKGKRKTVIAANLKHATAIRVAGHRLGSVLSVVAAKGGKFEITKASTKVTHRPKPKALKRAA